MCPNCTRGLTIANEVCPVCAGTGFWNPASLSVVETIQVMAKEVPVVEVVDTPVVETPVEVAPEVVPVEVAEPIQEAPVEEVPQESTDVQA